MGVEPTELKLVLVGDGGQFDPKPFQSLMETYDMLEWDFACCEPQQNPEPHLEVRLKGDMPLMAPYSTSQRLRTTSSLMANAQPTCTKLGVNKAIAQTDLLTMYQKA